MVYECNSEPNPVTNKQVRLENQTYFFYRIASLLRSDSGHLLGLIMWISGS